MVCAFVPMASISSRRSSKPFFSWVNAATMDTSAEPSPPTSAATLPPPGAAELVDNSSAKPCKDIPASLLLESFTA